MVEALARDVSNLKVGPATKENCVVCDKPDARACAGCKSCSYCSKECQQNDWCVFWKTSSNIFGDRGSAFWVFCLEEVVANTKRLKALTQASVF